MALPDGYDTDVNKRGGRVSAGQRQLLSFARAFLADPAVLILDEATASLDIPSERLVQEGLTDPARRPHGDHHRAPAVDGRDRRPGARDGARPHRRGRHAGRPDRRHRSLREAARRVARFARLTRCGDDLGMSRTGRGSDLLEHDEGAPHAHHHPSLWFDDDLEQAIEFYGSIFGDAKVSGEQRLPDGSLLGATFELLGQRVMGLNGGPGHPHTDAFSFVVGVRVRTRSTATGTRCSPAAVARPRAAGSSTGSAWPGRSSRRSSMAAVATPTPRRRTYAMQAMLKQQKIVIGELTAYAGTYRAARRSTRKPDAVGGPEEGVPSAR